MSVTLPNGDVITLQPLKGKVGGRYGVQLYSFVIHFVQNVLLQRQVVVESLQSVWEIISQQDKWLVKDESGRDTIKLDSVTAEIIFDAVTKVTEFTNQLSSWLDSNWDDLITLTQVAAPGSENYLETEATGDALVELWIKDLIPYHLQHSLTSEAADAIKNWLKGRGALMREVLTSAQNSPDAAPSDSSASTSDTTSTS